MTETLYWVTRLDAINKAFEVMFVISALIVLFSGVGALIACECAEILRPLKKILTVSIITATIGGVGYTLTPTTKEMLTVKVLGSTIEYLQENEKARELPDKAIELIYELLETEKDGEK